MASLRYAVAVCACLLSLQYVAAQQSGGTQPAGGNSGGTTTPVTTTPTNPTRTPIPTQPQTQQPTPQMPQTPIFLSGRVVLDDGSPVPPGESIVIETVCNGVVRPEGYADTKGRFEFEFGGRNPNVLPDASTGPDPGVFTRGGASPMGTGGGSDPLSVSMPTTLRIMRNCELQARLPGYRSDTINLFNRQALDNPNVGSILLHRLGKVEGRVVSATNMAAPKEASKAFDKGREALAKGKLDDARKELEKATQVYPSYAAAWVALSEVDTRQQRNADARAALEKAIQADPRFIDPYLQLINMQARAAEWKDLADTTATVIKLDPYDYPIAFYYNGVASYFQKDMAAAEKSVREAIHLDTRKQLPKAHELLGTILAERGEYADAAVQLREYLSDSPQAADADRVKAQLAQIDSLAARQGPKQ